MKRLIRKSKGLIKGTPSAVLISAAIHGILLFVAGGLVVFNVIQKMEKKFVAPPPVERPKMELIKPKVKVKKTVKPGASQRIVSKTVARMPEMQLPALEGMGKGLGTEIGGFDLMPDISQLGMLGGTKSMAVGNDFEGTFYSLQYDRSGKKIPMSEDTLYSVLREFMDADWNPIVFAPYFRGPQKLYTTQFMVPPLSSENCPGYFGVDLSQRKMLPAFWVAHYKGKIARKEGGRYRFWGSGDNFFVVRVNKEVVWNANFLASVQDDLGDWDPENDETGRYHMGHGYAHAGHWFELEPGVPVEMEVFFGEEAGGWTKAMLSVEDATVDYPKNREGMPVLPIFKTADLPTPLREQIEYLLIRGEVELNDPLKFNVY